MSRATICCLLVLTTAAGADPVPTLHESFDKGPIDGPVGKADKRFSGDVSGVVNMERGTIAFFVQSTEAPRETEWGGPGGIRARRDSGYWSMGLMFQTRRQAFLLNLFDAGFYSPPMTLPTIFGRWQAGQWHHLAAAWDRNEGIRAYEDGKEVFSNWGTYHWHWSLVPGSFSLTGPVDEVYVFAEPLTAVQIAQLALGQKPTGDPIPVTGAAERRERDLARMGWSDPSRAAMPTVAPDEPRP